MNALGQCGPDIWLSRAGSGPQAAYWGSLMYENPIPLDTFLFPGCMGWSWFIFKVVEELSCQGTLFI